MKPLDNHNPAHHKALGSSLQQCLQRIQPDTLQEVEVAFQAFYRYAKLKFEIDSLIKNVEQNTEDVEEIKTLLENIEKLKQDSVNIQVPPLQTCIPNLHIDMKAELLKAKGAKDPTMTIFRDRKDKYAHKIANMEKQWRNKLLILEKNDKQWLPYLKRRMTYAWQSIQKTWTHVIKPLAAAIYESTLMSPFAEIVHFLGKPLLKRLKIKKARGRPLMMYSMLKKNTAKNTETFKLKAIGASLGFVFMYFMEMYFIVRMIIVGQMLQKLGWHANSSNYIKHSLMVSMINAGIIIIESFYFGELYFATMLTGMLGGAIITHMLCYFNPALLPMPGIEASEHQKFGLQFVSMLGHLLGTILTKQGMQQGVIFNKLILREQAKGYLNAVKKQGLVDDLHFEMPNYFTDPTLWFDNENPLILTWFARKQGASQKYSLGSYYQVRTDCQISAGMLTCAPVRCEVPPKAALTFCSPVPRLPAPASVH